MTTSYISDRRLCWDKHKGPHLACWVTWHATEPRHSVASGEHATSKQSTLKHWVPRPAALSEHCNLTVLLRATSRIADPAASGTSGYKREAVALRCKCARYRPYCREAPGRSQARVAHSVSVAHCLQADLSQQRHWRSHGYYVTVLTPAALQRAGRDTTVIPQTTQV